MLITGQRISGHNRFVWKVRGVVSIILIFFRNILSVVSCFHWVIIETIADIYWMLTIEGTGTSYIVSILMLTTSEVRITLTDEETGA